MSFTKLQKEVVVLELFYFFKSIVEESILLGIFAFLTSNTCTIILNFAPVQNIYCISKLIVNQAQPPRLNMDAL